MCVCVCVCFLGGGGLPALDTIIAMLINLSVDLIVRKKAGEQKVGKVLRPDTNNLTIYD